MQTKRRRMALALIGAMALTGMTHLPAAHAQDAPVRRAKITIHTPQGDQEFEVDPDQLPSLDGNHQGIIAHVGPDGQLLAFAGDPSMLRMLDNYGVFNGALGLSQTGGMNIIDPGQSYLAQLLRREDVRAQLYITPRQREALEGIEKSQQASVKQQFTKSVSFLGDDVKGKTQTEIRQIAEQYATRMGEQMQNVTNESNKKISSILTAPQRTRLEELDKQWRGPLAMGVKDVAQQAQLTDAQAPVVTDLLKQYHKEVSSHLSLSSPAAQKTQNVPNGNGAFSASFSPQERQAKREQLHKEIEKARQALGEKALSELNTKQRMQWSALTGKPFVFRNN